MKTGRGSDSALIPPPSSLILYLSVEPGLRHPPLSLDSGRTYAENFSCFFHRETTEKTQLHDATLLGIEFGKAFERFVERHQFVGSTAGDVDIVVERELLKLTAAFISLLSARMVD